MKGPFAWEYLIAPGASRLSSPASTSECSWPGISDLSRLVELDGLGCSFSDEAVKETFNITREEMEAVGEGRIEDLVIERVALADTYR